MRVIAGSAKRAQLKTIEGLETRPTLDRIKETLFNMIQYDLYDGVFLDLFAGSGGIGIEALSRGCKKAFFIERNPQAVSCIRENLLTTRLEEKGVVIPCEVIPGLGRIPSGIIFDFVFMDPPYDQLLEKEVLEYFATKELMTEEGIFIIEASKNTDFDYVEALGYEVIKEKKYKTNKHVFIRKI